MRWLPMVLVGFVFTAGILAVAATPGRQISGVVTDGAHPAAGAVVRLQGTELSATTNASGEFSLDLSDRITWPIARLTVWASGYYIAGPFYLFQGQSGVRLTVKRHPEEDYSGYAWLSAMSEDGQPSNCQNCHSSERANSLLPFDEWMRDAHGTSAQNRRFLSMYNGTDLSGDHASPPTRYFVSRDYGKVPLPPDPTQPYFGPGFKLDFPESAGNCAACHLPNAAANAPYDTDPNTVQGVGKEGVGCDLCHKIWSVQFDSSTGLPYPNTPGVLSLQFRRPHGGEQLFLGPFDDVAPGDDSYSALQNDSRICAPCHFAQFWGVQVYNSFGEWLESPYSDPVTGRTCQDCHMPRRGARQFALFEKGGLLRDANTVFSHRMPGAADEALLQDTADLHVDAVVVGSTIRATVTVANRNGGHHIPTDHPARNILLVVSAKDAAGGTLALLQGPVIPSWGGEGAAPDDYAGRPGRGYAKILEELWTEVSPTAAYWNPTVLRDDTRIPALGRDVSRYQFALPPAGGTVTIEAALVFRRAFKVLTQQKNWDAPDIPMERESVTIWP